MAKRRRANGEGSVSRRADGRWVATVSIGRDGNGRVNITDSLAILGGLFQGRVLKCDDAADFNDSGDLNLTDAVVMLEYLFRAGGTRPPPPFPLPGVDPTPDNLVCD